MRGTFALAYGMVERFEAAMAEIVPAMVGQGWRLVGAFRSVTGDLLEVTHLWQLPDAASLTEAPRRAFSAHPELLGHVAELSGILRGERLELLAPLSYDPSPGVSGTDVLWRPLAIGPREVANRLLVSAHGTSHDLERYAAYLGTRARGGAGLIVTGAIPVHPTSDLQWFAGWDPETATAYRRLADAVHAHGGTVFGQLHHYGPQGLGTGSLETAHALVAASPVPSPVFDVQPRALRTDEIPEIVEAFASAAAIMRDGGLDGAEVHAAHGYLLHTFLSPLSNRRTDAYGGDAAGRARIVLEVGRAVRSRIGRDFPVGLKLGFEEFVGPRGTTPQAAAETLAVIHAEGLFDYVSISGAAYHAIHELVATMESGRSGHLAEHAAAAKAVVGALPVMVTGAIRSVERAAEIVAAGQADMVGMVRAHLADPDIVRKARDGDAAAIRPCVGANQGCWRRAFRGQHVGCTVNPEAGREAEWGDAYFAPVEHPGRVLVLGGGPAGLKAAESAARRGHDVVLLEREAQLGGQLRAAGRLPGRDRWHLLVAHLERSLDRLGVDVRLGAEATADTAAELDADLTVVATGAAWDTSGFSVLRPDRDAIPGADGGLVLDPEAAIADVAACGRRTLIVDDHGTHLALGLAELLARDGREVEFVTAHPQPGVQTGVLGTVDAPWVQPRLARAGVRFSSEATVERIDGRRVTLAHVHGAWAREVDEVDAVVLCQGRSSRDALFTALRARGAAIECIGDALAPREVDDAILEGARSGRAVRVPDRSLA